MTKLVSRYTDGTLIMIIYRSVYTLNIVHQFESVNRILGCNNIAILVFRWFTNQTMNFKKQQWDDPQAVGKCLLGMICQSKQVISHPKRGSNGNDSRIWDQLTVAYENKDRYPGSATLTGFGNCSTTGARLCLLGMM